MADPQASPAVALLFADESLGQELRNALAELGARIVHAGPTAKVSTQELATCGAEVVVVDLGAEEGEELDHLCNWLEEQDTQVIFNDAEATRGLSGWDRARWARHLAVKLMGTGDVDPPRPSDARAVDVASAGESPATAARVQAEMPAGSRAPDRASGADQTVAEPPAAPVVETALADEDPSTTMVSPDAEPVADEPVAQAVDPEPSEDAGQSEALAAELEALLAQDESAPESPDAVPAQAGPALELESGPEDAKTGPADAEPEFESVDEAGVPDEAPAEPEASLAALELDDFGPQDESAPAADASRDAAFEHMLRMTEEALQDVPADPGLDAPREPAQAASDVMSDDSGFAGIELSLAGDEDDGSAGRAEAEKPAPVQAPGDWDLADLDLEPPPPPPDAGPARADDDEGTVAAPVPESPVNTLADSLGSGLNLELVALEDPTPVHDPERVVSEMRLDASTNDIRELAVLAAGRDALPEVAEFLGALPASFTPLILVVMHQAGQRADQLAEALNEASPVRVRVAGEQAVMARPGQIWLIPAGQYCELGRAGRLSLKVDADMQDGSPSVDHCLDALLPVFTSRLTVVLLDGQGSDAVNGLARCSARGAAVWLQDPETCSPGSMVGAVFDMGLNVRTGSPENLARLLCEDQA